jgi:glycosidase
MVWDDMSYDPEFMGPDGKRMGPNEVKFDRGLHAFFKAAISLRRNTPVLNAGAFQWLTTDDAANTLAFLRSGGNARAVIVFNRSESPQTVRFAAPDGWPESDQPADFVSDGGSAVLRRVGGELLTDLAPLTAAVFLP